MPKENYFVTLKSQVGYQHPASLVYEYIEQVLMDLNFQKNDNVKYYFLQNAKSALLLSRPR